MTMFMTSRVCLATCVDLPSQLHWEAGGVAPETDLWGDCQGETARCPACCKGTTINCAVISISPFSPTSLTYSHLSFVIHPFCLVLLLCLCLSLFGCLFVFFSLSLCLISLSLSLSLTLSLSFSVSVSLSPSLFVFISLCLSLSVCLFVSVSLSLCLCVCIFVSLSVCLSFSFLVCASNGDPPHSYWRSKQLLSLWSLSV